MTGIACSHFKMYNKYFPVNTTPKCNNNSEVTKTADILDARPASPSDDSVSKGNLNVSTGSTDSGLSSDGVRPTDQLTYLAQILGFKVSHRDYLTEATFEFVDKNVQMLSFYSDENVCAGTNNFPSIFTVLARKEYVSDSILTYC